MKISKLVTDGADTWLLTRQYLYYTSSEALKLYKDYCKANGIYIIKD